jgi:hypothetical protein
MFDSPPIRQTHPMRRTMTLIIFGLCVVSLSTLTGGWILRRVAFDPGHTASTTGAILADQAIVDAIANPVSRIAAVPLPQDPGTLRAIVRLVARHPDGHQFFESTIRAASERLLKRRLDTVHLTGEELIPILRTQEAYGVPPVVIEVPRSRVLAIVDSVLPWAMLAALVLFPLTLVLMVLIRPERGLLIYAAGGSAICGVLTFVAGWVVPKFAIPAIGTSPWLDMAGAVADSDLWITLLVTVAFLAGGVMLFLRAADQQRRRPSRSSSYYRYSDDRRWS